MKLRSSVIQTLENNCNVYKMDIKLIIGLSSKACNAEKIPFYKFTSFKVLYYYYTTEKYKTLNYKLLTFNLNLNFF